MTRAIRRVFIALLAVFLSVAALRCLMSARAEAVEIGEPANQWRLMSWNGVTLDLLECLDPQTGARQFAFRMLSDNSDISHLNVGNIVLNDRILILGSNSVDRNEFSILSIGAEILPANEISQFSCDIEVVSSDYEYVHRETATVRLPPDRQPQIVFLPFHDVFAEEQILYNSERGRITLLGLGQLLSVENESNYYDWIDGVLLFENVSDLPLYFNVTGLSINNLYTDSLTSHAKQYAYIEIPPHGACLYDFKHRFDSNYDDSEEELSLSEFGLQMALSREAPEKGDRFAQVYWFSVELTGSEGGGPAFEEGEVVYENGSLRIGFRGFTDDSESYWSDNPHYNWKLSVTNESDDDISLRICDIQFDGVETNGDILSENLIYILPDVIGAQKQLYANITASMGDDIPPPEELSFRIQVRAQLGEKLLYTTDAIRLTSK